MAYRHTACRNPGRRPRARPRAKARDSCVAPGAVVAVTRRRTTVCFDVYDEFFFHHAREPTRYILIFIASDADTR